MNTQPRGRARLPLELTMEGLLALAQEMGVTVTYADTGGEGFLIAGEGEEPPVVILPSPPGRLEPAWVLAHELGHFALGHRPGLKPQIIQEIEAWHWAKKLLRDAPAHPRAGTSPKP